MAWRAATYGHLGRVEEAQHFGGLFVQSATSLWLGDPRAGPAEYVDWFVDVSFLQRGADVENLRGGLRLAGLPA